MLSTSRIISLTLAGQWFLASRLVSVRQRAVAYSNANISTPGDREEAALARRPVPAQRRYRATAPDRTPDVGTAPRSRIDKERAKAVSLSIK
jgi:hypothetical protein